MAKKSKAKRRINIFDAVVILLLVCLIVTFGYRMYVGLSDESSSGTAKYIMTFECEQGYDSLINYIEEGEAVYLLRTGSLLGYFYVPADDDNGHIYSLSGDVPTSAEKNDGDEKETENYFNNNLTTVPIQTYSIIKLGGHIRLNVETVKVKNGNYYSIGEMNFTEGSVIEVCTDDTVFAIKVKQITTSD